MEIVLGKVIKGNNRGKLLGFPTANVKLEKEIPQGIYVSQVEVHGSRFTVHDKYKVFHALTFIGNAKTFGEKEVFAETYILDFSEDIYGKEIKVQLLHKIRENQKFTTENELIKQM